LSVLFQLAADGKPSVYAVWFWFHCFLMTSLRAIKNVNCISFVTEVPVYLDQK
jgi:hypothetical protein